MLKYLNVGMKDLDENDVKDQNSGEVVLLKSICTNALLFQDQASNMTGDQKLQRFALAKKIHDSSDSVDLSAEEVSLTKDAVNKLYTPLSYGRVVEALDPKEK